jgi:hypothetical protein
MKNKSLYLALSVAALMVMIAPVLVAQEQNSTPSATEKRAMTILKNMSQYLANAEHFSVTIRDDYDAVQASGEKIQFGSLRKVTVSRPDRLRIEVERSDGEKGLVLFNGKDITVYTPNKNVYASVSRPGTLDDALKYAVDDLKLRVPLAMMLLSTLPTELDNLVVSADYVETTTLTDVPCDHIAARTSRGVDFQVWVAQGSEPQFRADLSNWNLAPDISEALFTFTPPDGADRIQFLAEVGNAAATATPKKGGEK